MVAFGQSWPWGCVSAEQPDQKVLTRAEVADLFKVSERTVRRWEDAGIVRRVEPAGRPRYSAAELLALVEAGR